MDRPRFYLQWHITHACNLRCAHCYQEEYKSHMPRAELFSALDSFGDLLRGRDVEPQINLTGGEPLLHPDFYDLCGEIRRRGYRLGVLTNGTLIDREAAEKLAALHPVFVQISLDGTRRIHDSIRGKGAFDRALNGVDRLKEAGVRVLVSFTAQRNNCASFAALAAVCRAHGVDKLWWDRVVTEDPALAVTTRQFRRLVHTANRLRREEGSRGGTPMVSCGRALQFGSDPCAETYRCSAGENMLILLADGSLMPCRRLPFVIGNLHDVSMRDLAESSPLMRQLRAPCVPEGCAGCRHLIRCGGGARCVTLAQTGRLDLRDVNCFYRRFGGRQGRGSWT